MNIVNEEKVQIRLAKPEDSLEIAAFYSPYVLNTAINFEYDPPSAEEYRKRIIEVQQRLPFIVATNWQGKVIGYVYASPMRLRPAFAWSIVTSIYLDSTVRGKGIGTRLYKALEMILRQQHIVNMFACITVSKDDDLADIYGGVPDRKVCSCDPHLPATSPRFHASIGFVPVGREIDCGYKLGRWYDKLWMEKQINPRKRVPEDIILLPKMDSQQLDDILNASSEE